jgi:hypothetical protein
MSFWKVLGGVALGVGAVAAAPFTGGGSLLGAASLAGSLAGGTAIAAAVGAGVAGGVVAAASENEDVAKARREGERDGKKQAQELLDAIAAYKIKVKSAEQHYSLVVAMHAVGLACANCDGDISSEESEEIDAFVSGAARANIPKGVKEQLTKLRDNPPSIQTAYKLASKLEYFPKDLFENLIELTMYADGNLHPSEIAFKSAWKELAA